MKNYLDYNKTLQELYTSNILWANTHLNFTINPQLNPIIQNNSLVSTLGYTESDLNGEWWNINISGKLLAKSDRYKDLINLVIRHEICHAYCITNKLNTNDGTKVFEKLISIYGLTTNVPLFKYNTRDIVLSTLKDKPIFLECNIYESLNNNLIIPDNVNKSKFILDYY